MLATPFLVAQLLFADASEAGPWLLTCEVGTPGTPSAAAVRVFRVGPQLLQEMKAGQKTFGPNLCQSFRCKTDRSRLEGSVESASVIFTVTLDPKTRRATWKTQGATGQARTTGPCTAQRDKTG